ncbi:hypothetical protein N0V90_006233 [Kalmusia sp. IMI 367209]|nr:hypothetical protein N0V90_006233 [Kalmusia sp. IMI 367209]
MACDSHGCYIGNSTIGGQTAGRGFFSGRDIKNGESIATLKRPLMTSLEAERLKDTCANCYVWTEGSSIGSRLYVKEGTTVQTCAGCKRFRYCSRVCQKEAWNRGHKHECKNLKSVADRELPKAVLGCMEILIRRKHGLIPDSVWQLLCQLESHIEDFKSNGNYGGIELMALGTSQFSATQDRFSKDFVAAMYARILSNSMTLITPTFDPLGIVIDAVFCHINHSCDPNVYIVMDGPQMQIRTLKDIKKNEEIFISYIDPTMSYARRQSELQQRWFFTCRCTKCQVGPTQQEDEWQISFEDLPTHFKHVADQAINQSENAEDPADYVGDSVDERRVAAIQGQVFQLYEEEQRQTDPNEAISIIDNAIEVCCQSRLWPPHRQPLPALRDDLIVNMLSVGNFEGAWFQCAKRYRHVIPKLYPQMHHPIRVVQTWQMAMMAQYLASAGTEVAPGADMALIAAMLINTINVTSRLSHGADSAFSKSVQHKFSEVEGEMLGKFGSKDAMNAAIQRQVKLLSEMGQ